MLENYPFLSGVAFLKDKETVSSQPLFIDVESTNCRITWEGRICVFMGRKGVRMAMAVAHDAQKLWELTPVQM